MSKRLAECIFDENKKKTHTLFRLVTIIKFLIDVFTQKLKNKVCLCFQVQNTDPRLLVNITYFLYTARSKTSENEKGSFSSFFSPHFDKESQHIEN